MSDTDSNEACFGQFLPGVSYPRYSITTEGGKHVILSGPLCGNSIGNVCEALLPPTGLLEFRVFGFGVSPYDYHWEFCGERGTIGGGVDFHLRDGKCVVEKVLTDEQDYALEYDIALDASLSLTASAGDGQIVGHSNYMLAVSVTVGVAAVASILVALRYHDTDSGGEMEVEPSSVGPSSHGSYFALASLASYKW